MGNHFHLLLETLEPNLSAGMRVLLGTYSQAWYSRYIHLNPARAGLAGGGRDRLEDYPRKAA